MEDLPDPLPDRYIPLSDPGAEQWRNGGGG